VSRVRCEGTDCDGFEVAVAVGLEDQDGARLGGVERATRYGPDLAALHGLPAKFGERGKD